MKSTLMGCHKIVAAIAINVMTASTIALASTASAAPMGDTSEHDAANEAAFCYVVRHNPTYDVVEWEIGQVASQYSTDDGVRLIKNAITDLCPDLRSVVMAVVEQYQQTHSTV